MGWTGHDLPNKGWKLFTRGGARGVYIQHINSKEEIDIPSEMIFMLVAAEIRNYKIGELEQTEDYEILGLPKA